MKKHLFYFIIIPAVIIIVFQSRHCTAQTEKESRISYTPKFVHGVSVTEFINTELFRPLTNISYTLSWSRHSISLGPNFGRYGNAFPFPYDTKNYWLNESDGHNWFGSFLGSYSFFINPKSKRLNAFLIFDIEYCFFSSNFRWYDTVITSHSQKLSTWVGGGCRLNIPDHWFIFSNIGFGEYFKKSIADTNPMPTKYSIMSMCYTEDRFYYHFNVIGKIGIGYRFPGKG